MDIYLPLLINWNERTITINNKPIEIEGDDEIGSVSLNVTKLTEKESSVTTFEEIIEQMLNNDEIIDFNNYCGASKSITIKEGMKILNKNRVFVDDLYALGVKYKVLMRGNNSDWKAISPIMRERMLANAKWREELKNPSSRPKTQEEVLQNSLSSIKQMRESQEVNDKEEVAYDPEVDGSVKENVHTVAIKPGVPINKKVLTKKKPALSKPLVVNKKRT